MNRDYSHRRSEFSGAQFSCCRCGNSVVCWPDTTSVPPQEWGADCPAALRERIAEQDRHISSLDCRFAGHVAELSGKHCPPGQPCERCEAEARAERAEAERDAAMDEALRLRDLVRHQRGALHDAELLTDAEYAALAADAGAVARLQGYDEVRRESRADTDKAIAAALEAKAKELDKYARDYFPGVEHPSVVSFRNGVYKAVRIVRGAP